MRIKTVSAFEMVRIIDLQPSGFCVLLIPAGEPVFLKELERELGIQAELTLAVIDGTTGGVDALLDKVRIQQEPVGIILGLEQWSDVDFADLDINRSRLETSGFFIFAADSRTAARLLDRAPNLRSFVGANIFVWVPDTAVMDSEEIDVRLKELREHYGKTDDQVVDAAREGTLPADPQFVEWLILLGRGELVR